MNNIKKIIFFLFINTILIFFDQLTKHFAIIELKSGKVIKVIENILEFVYVENRGAAFGILQDKQYFFYIITFIIVCLLIFIIYKIPLNKRFLPLLITLNLIFSGAIGNFIDRFLNKFVVDFIYFKPIDFPVFNVADCYITVSCFFLMLLMLFYYDDEELKKIKWL